MKEIKIVLIAVMFVALITSLCACEFDESRKSFSGGELLDEEKLSELKNSLYTEETGITETENSSHKEGEIVSAESGSEIVGTDETNATDVTGTGEASETRAESDGQTVYWTESGSVWHVDRECSYLSRSKNVLSGTIEEANEEGKSRLCSICGK